MKAPMGDLYRRMRRTIPVASCLSGDDETLARVVLLFLAYVYFHVGPGTLPQPDDRYD